MSDHLFGSRIGPLRENLNAAEWARYLAEQLLLFPAATWLPLNAAIAIADAIGAADAALPTSTSRSVRNELAALGVPAAQISRGTREKLAFVRRDIVWRQRFRRGRERFEDWQMIETNGEAVHELVASKRAFIAAGGHFVSAAGDLRHKVVPALGMSVGGAIPRWRLSPFELRRRLDAIADEGAREGLLRMGTHGRDAAELNAAVPDIWERDLNWANAPAYKTVQDQVLADLAIPGAVSQILVDAWWEKPTAYRRPFAGIADRGFALGAARIARIAQVPVVPFVAVLGPKPRTVLYDWGDPILPGAPDDKESDRAVMDQALAFIEAGIQRYPTQYMHPSGSDRHYNPTLGAFIDPRTPSTRQEPETASTAR